jgi:hypothetical protein
MSDQILSEILSTPVSTIEDVLSVMQQIDAALPDEDGLKWFNLLYMKVTRSVLENPPAEGWAAPEWLARLDVIFGGLYFEALRNWIKRSASAPKAWRVFFDARSRTNLMRIQFALCGMNAHINRDLEIALVHTCEEHNIAPEKDTPQHRDYEHVNGILEAVEAEIKPILAVGIIAGIDANLGRLDDILAMWSIKAARDKAWGDAQLLWLVRKNPFARKLKIDLIDGFTGAFGRGLIIPVT